MLGFRCLQLGRAAPCDVAAFGTGVRRRAPLAPGQYYRTVVSSTVRSASSGAILSVLAVQVGAVRAAVVPWCRALTQC